MKKHIGISLFFMGCFLSLSATNYFVATMVMIQMRARLTNLSLLYKKRSQKSFPEIRYIFAEASIGYGKSR